MKDLDSRWDVDALRLANDFSGAAGADRGVLVARVFQDMQRRAGARAVPPSMPALATALAEKSAAFTAPAAHDRSLKALAAFDAQPRPSPCAPKSAPAWHAAAS